MSDIARVRTEVVMPAKQDGETPAADTARPPRRRRGRRLVAIAASLVAAGFGAFAVGFVVFAAHVAAARPPADPHADGIVVLTGGAWRIDEALQLLSERRGRRLLISGVNSRVSRKALAGVINDELDAAFACCADIDRRALDTVGNAAEAARWVEKQGFTSLIVVTSAYHMPRSMSELSKAMPAIDLIPYPVNNPDLHLDTWWRNRGALELLLHEYGKFLLAEARLTLMPSDADAR